MSLRDAAATVLMCGWICSFTFDVEGVPASPGVDYLKIYGYLKDSQSNRLTSKDSLTEAIMMFQSFAGLPTTGVLDEATQNRMQQKRCGNSDVIGSGRKRKKRFSLEGSKWDKRTLTYGVSRYPRRLRASEVDREIAAAFQWWSEHSPLVFVRSPRGQSADIIIMFAIGDHGDIDPFDGGGQTLAHAFFPALGGDVHFDDDEPWQLTPSRDGVRLRIVAAHELGHSLGLAHSPHPPALMAPFYNPESDGLEMDDVAGIQRLYGVRTGSTSTSTSLTTMQPELPSSCNGRFDAIAQLRNGSTYAFQGEQFWKLNGSTAEEGYPQETRRVWGIVGKIDAALSYTSYLELFQDRFIHRYENGRRVFGFPRTISSVYKGIPSHIDAVFQWSGNRQLYFIKGNEYWRYNFSTEKVDAGYPRPLSTWRGLPDRIDAALQWNSRTYFFRSGVYYRFDDISVQVAQLQRRPYPRRADRWWLSCTDNTLTFEEDIGEEEDTEVMRINGNNAGSKIELQFALYFLTVASLVCAWLQ